MSRLLLILICWLLAYPAAAQPADAPVAEENAAHPQPAPDSLTNVYYSVKMPAGWKVIQPPEEKQGNVSSIFSTDNGDCVVTLVMGPTLGASAETIASMFAEEFKAPGTPRLKNGAYGFSFPQNGSVCKATVSVEGGVFKLVTVNGDQKKADVFLATSIQAPEAPAKANADPPAPEDKGDAVKKDPESANPDTPAKDAEKPGPSSKDESKKAENDPKSGNAQSTKESSPGEPSDSSLYSCQFYTAKLPSDWKAVIPPTEQQGNINAIFSNGNGSTSITLIVGPSLGADAESIASMFAEQFKATGKIKNNNGQYSFAFVQNGLPATAIVAVSQREFLLAASRGDGKEIANFYKNALSSEKYPDLLPRP
ncbi:MAG: hypothetical protein K2H64_12730 [Desulfovibrio sp.]|nr:hypothetical protein [Desulfovibrio sp.]